MHDHCLAMRRIVPETDGTLSVYDQGDHVGINIVPVDARGRRRGLHGVVHATVKYP
jgi:hypothetical protein